MCDKVVGLQVLAESGGGGAKSGRNCKTDSAQADKGGGLCTDCLLVNILGAIQSNDFDLAHDKNSSGTNIGNLVAGHFAKGIYMLSRGIHCACVSFPGQSQ